MSGSLLQKKTLTNAAIQIIKGNLLDHFHRLLHELHTLNWTKKQKNFKINSIYNTNQATFVLPLYVHNKIRKRFPQKKKNISWTNAHRKNQIKSDNAHQNNGIHEISVLSHFILENICRPVYIAVHNLNYTLPESPLNLR